MRLKHLSFQAIGPFPGKHEIDFDRLSGSGLFLLEGQTGSGKTTIIDAIVYALYGDVSGNNSVTSRMRSDHADPKIDTWIELTFETSAGCYKVRREPEYERPKLRGNGVTKTKAKATLVRVDPDGTPLPGGVHSVREVSEEIYRIVGLTKEQFTQVVVLPQGQFAKFLQAGTKERAKLLQRVFGTQIYEQVQNLLLDSAKTARARRAETLQQAKDLVQRLTAAISASETETEQLLNSLELGHNLAPIICKIKLRLEKGKESAVAALNQASEQALKDEQLLKSQQDLAKNLQRRQELLTQSKQLQEKSDDITEIKARMEAALRASSVQPLIQATNKERTNCFQAQTALDDLLVSIKDSEDADLAHLEADIWEEKAKELGTQKDQLSALVEFEKQVLQARQKQQESQHELEQNKAQIILYRNKLQAQEKTCQELKQSLDNTQTIANKLPLAIQAQQAAQKNWETTQEYTRIQKECIQKETVFQQAVKKSNSCQEKFLQIRARWIANQAARLAKDLSDQQPCPVCGSTEHPNLASQKNEVTDAILETAQSTWEQANRNMVTAKTQWEEVCSQVQQLETKIVPDAENKVKEADQLVNESQNAAKAASKLQEEWDKANKEQQDTIQKLSALEAASKTLQTQLDAQQKNINTQWEQIAAARSGFDSVKQRQELLERRFALAQNLADKHAELQRTQKAVNEAQTNLAKELEQQRFADVASAQQAVLTDIQISELQNQINQYEVDVLQVKKSLEDPKIAALTGLENPEVEPALQAFEKSKQVRDECRINLASWEAKCQALTTYEADIAAKLQRLAQIDSSNGPLIRLATLASGNNVARQTLATFVLVQKFGDVLSAANTRLAVMTSGRYQMLRSADKEAGSREMHTGLGIEIIDNETEKVRSPKSLSGGETFQFSLCLALGLADVVTGESGGIEVQTLFIDEGFGSLDSEVLEVVMRELTALHRQGNRAVGVVSHVAEMKNQISERVVVKKTRLGSTLDVVA